MKETEQIRKAEKKDIDAVAAIYADYIKSWAMPNRISCPAYLTEYQMCSWCC